MKRIFGLSIAMPALFASLALAAAAQAERASTLNGGEPSTVVKYYDLDTSTSAGMRELYGRLQRAARIVCRSLRPSFYVSPDLYEKKCVRAAIDKAVRGANKPRLTAIHDGQIGEIAKR